MPGFTKLFSEIITSSVWNEEDKTRIVWVTMMASSDASGMVRASVSGLAHIARVDRASCERALEVLSSPDSDSRSPEFEGRRIQKVEGGWLILNYVKYREARHEDERKAYMASYMRDYRAKKRVNTGVNNSNGPLTTVNHSKPPLANAEAEAEYRRRKSTGEEKGGGGGEGKFSLTAGQPAARRKGPTLTDDLFLAELKRHYPDINLERELHRMDAWLLTPQAKGRKRTRRFVVNWLNKCDTPMQGNGQKPKPRSSTYRPDNVTDKYGNPI